MSYCPDGAPCERGCNKRCKRVVDSVLITPRAKDDKLERIREEIDGPFGLSMGSRLASRIREILDGE